VERVVELWSADAPEDIILLAAAAAEGPAIVAPSFPHRRAIVRGYQTLRGRSWSGFGYRSFVFGGRPIAVAGNEGD